MQHSAHAFTEITSVVRTLANEIAVIRSESIIVNKDLYTTFKDEVIEEISEKVNNMFVIIVVFQQLGNLRKIMVMRFKM